MVDTLDSKAFSETYDIVMHFDKKLYDKIPKSFIKLLKDNMDVNYKPNIDYSKGINNQKLLDETRTFLALIYRDFICSKEKRAELIQKEKIELNKIEKEKKAKYSTTDLFANTNAVKRSIEDSKDNVTENYIIEHPKDSVADNHIEDNDSKSKQLVKYDNQKWYVRLFKKILGFFKRN